jgi:hypothetical protein
MVLVKEIDDIITIVEIEHAQCSDFNPVKFSMFSQTRATEIGSVFLVGALNYVGHLPYVSWTRVSSNCS